MDRELASSLKDLGLTATEAAIYVALLEHCADGPISAYKLAQIMGRDPANMTKALSIMVKGGAVRMSGRRPRLYAPVAPVDFTGALIGRLQKTQKVAVKLLEEIGRPPEDESFRTLESRQRMFAVARQLLHDAGRVVLVDASPEIMSELADDLARVAAEQGASVLARSTVALSIPGVRVWAEPGDDILASAAPGPWLRMTVDGQACLEVACHPGDPDLLLHGLWSRSPSQAYLAHRQLGAELILADVLELLREGAGAELIRRRAEDQAALILRQVGWRRRWREAGLPDWDPGSEVVDVVAPEEVAQALAELAAENEPARFEPESPGQAVAAAEAGSAAEEDGEDAGGPLKFIFRRRKKGDDQER